MRGLILLVSLLAFNSTAETNQNTAAKLVSNQDIAAVAITEPNLATLNWSEWPLVGSAELQVFLFDIYSSYLHAPAGNYRSLEGVADHPLALSILYARDINQQDLVDETVKQWRHLGYNDTQIALWQQKITAVFPRVNKGDRLTYITDGVKGWLLFQPEPVSQQPGSHQILAADLDKGFNEAFLSIWLSENTKYPKHRKQLIGEK
jgi:hypothetical protein